MKKGKIRSLGLSVALVVGVLAGAYGVSIASHTLSPYTKLHTNLWSGGTVTVDYKSILEYFGGKFVPIGQGKNGVWYPTNYAPGDPDPTTYGPGARPVNNEDCIFCHGNKKVESSPAMGMGEPVISAHKKHFFSVLLNFYINSPSPGDTGDTSKPAGVADTGRGCAACHEKIAVGYENDLSYNMTAAWTKSIRKTVEPVRCVNCHGLFRLVKSINGPANHLHTSDTPVAGGPMTDSYHCTPTSGMPPNGVIGQGGNVRGPLSASLNPPTCGWRSYSVAYADPRGCVRCHTKDNGVASDPATKHTNLWYLNQLYVSDAGGNYCLKCHGELNWYAGAVEPNYYVAPYDQPLNEPLPYPGPGQ